MSLVLLSLTTRDTLVISRLFEMTLDLHSMLGCITFAVEVVASTDEEDPFPESTEEEEELTGEEDDLHLRRDLSFFLPKKFILPMSSGEMITQATETRMSRYVVVSRMRT